MFHSFSRSRKYSDLIKYYLSFNIMSHTVANETYSLGIMEREAASNYILGPDSEPEKVDVYGRLFTNLNSTTSKNISIIIHNFAKMYFSENASNNITNATKIQLDDEISPKPLNQNNSKFDVANSEIILILLTVIYVTIFITGVLGNVVTCIVIARNKGMHTAVNYYLFSLAVSDLLLLISALPDEVYMLWFREYPFDETVCKIHKFAAESFTNATVLTITAFTIERYVAICKPFLSHTMSKLSRAYKFILVIWMISICLAVPQTLFTLHLDETYLICVPKQDFNHLFVVSTFLLFVIPMSIITILYVLIGLQLRKSKIVQRGAVNGSSVRLKRKIFKKAANQTLVTVNCDSHYNEVLLHSSSDANKSHYIDNEKIISEDGRINYSNRGPSHGSRHVVNMLVVVVIAFFLCWCPFHIQRIVFTYIEHRQIDENLSFSINYISGVLFFVSTCINPFLYNIMSNKFREAFKVTISSYFSRSTDKNSASNGKLFRTVSQRSYSYSVNSTSLNTCSSVCSMQPFNHSQQLPFRYFDSDMARKRPLVVSFRRIQKMTPSNVENNCGDSVSICDIHRLDTKLKEHNDVMAMKIMSKYGSNPLRIAMQKKGQSCRSFPSNDKQKFQLDSLYDESFFDPHPSDKGCVFPKEKFSLTMNDCISRKTTIDCDKDSCDQQAVLNHKNHQDCDSTHHLSINDVGHKIELPSKRIFDGSRHHANKLSLAVNNIISETGRKHREDKTEELSIDERKMATIKTNRQSKDVHVMSDEHINTINYERMEKSFSAPSVCALQKLRAFEEHDELERMETDEAFAEIQKSVSMMQMESEQL